MRLRTGHRPEDWSVSEPGHAILYRGSIRGELVTGGAGPNDRDVHNAESRTPEARARQREYRRRKAAA